MAHFLGNKSSIRVIWITLTLTLFSILVINIIIHKIDINTIILRHYSIIIRIINTVINVVTILEIQTEIDALIIPLLIAVFYFNAYQFCNKVPYLTQNDPKKYFTAHL